MFFYGHKQNRFWRVIASLYGEAVPETVEEKKVLIISHRLALWDSIAACTITGSSDASITDVVPTDLASVLAGSGIDRIFCNGAKSYEVYCRWQRPVLGIEAVKLPSTSPANVACSFDRLLEAWRAILPEEADPI